VQAIEYTGIIITASTVSKGASYELENSYLHSMRINLIIVGQKYYEGGCDMKRISVAVFLISSLSIVVSQTAFCQPKIEKGSSKVTKKNAANS
jgi:hypothetical protein